MAKAKILIISSMRSFLTESLKEKLVTKSYEVIHSSPTVESLSAELTRTSAIVVFSDLEIANDYSTMTFLKDRIVEEDIPLFLVGKAEDMAILETFFTARAVQHSYLRPVDINEIVDGVDKYIKFFKSAERKTILVVDDSGASLRTAKGWFESKYQVLLANSVMMAVKSMTLHKPDLILLDYNMPIIDGKQMLEMIKSESDFSDIPVMFLTGAGDAASVKSIMNLGPVAYLLKTMPPESIVSEVDKFFEEKKKKRYS